MAFEPAHSLLKSRSYIGLVLAQFLAAFNDQAIHFVAIFYAGDMLVRYIGAKHLDEKAIVTIVTACFIAPFFFFSPLAGVLADKFSKRNTLVGMEIRGSRHYRPGAVRILIAAHGRLGLGRP